LVDWSLIVANPKYRSAHPSDSAKMLGAQALRTKQRVEEKERKRREKEKQHKLETQRQSIQSAANEDQAAMLEFAAQQAAAATFNHHNNHHYHATKPHQRHSLHTTAINDIAPLSAREGSQHRLPPRSPSTDYSAKDTEGSSGGNRLFKWLGITSNNHKKQAKRRMSTY